MHYIELNDEAIKHLPEGFDTFSDMEENDYFYLENTDLMIAYNWDWNDMSEELQDYLNKFSISKVVPQVLKFCKPFEIAFGGYAGSYFFEYLHFDGKKLTHLSDDFSELVDDEDDYEAWSDLDNSVRIEGELSSEFLDGVNEIISAGNSYGLAFYDLDGNKID